MVKGFVFFKEGKIPFVINNYRMELFTDDDLLNDFSKEYNFKVNYILQGQYFGDGIQGQRATFLVEYSIGSTCYLHCYIINMFALEDGYDTIGLQSPFFDDIFRYKYKYSDMIKAGANLAVEPKDAYRVPFSMNSRQYELTFRIGHNGRFGLLEDFDRNGELLLPLKTDGIQECFDISVVLRRLAMFMIPYAEVLFKRITLYKKGSKVGWFFCPFVSEKAVSGYDVLFYNFDVMKYIPIILNNIALDSGNKITQSVPLGHLAGNFNSMFSSQRFVEQVIAFEYLFDKLEHQKAQDSKFPLKKELESMFNKFSKLLPKSELPSNEICEQIKEIRRSIIHGYAYYYDFKNDPNIQYLIILLDKLIRNMSLLWIGFTEDEIAEYLLR